MAWYNNPNTTPQTPPTTGSQASRVSAGVSQYGDAITNLGTAIGSYTPSGKKQAQQQFAADQNRFTATGGAQKLIDQYLEAQRRLRGIASAGANVKISDSARGVMDALKDPSSFNLKRNAAGGLEAALPGFDDPRFSGIEFGKVKGKALQQSAGYANAAASVPTVASPFLAAYGAIAGGIGRRREANSAIPAGEQNKLALDLMRQSLMNPSEALFNALKNERRAGAVESAGGQVSGAGDIISALRDPARLSESNLLVDPTTGKLVYAPTNVTQDPAVKEAKGGAFGGAFDRASHNRVGNVMTAGAAGALFRAQRGRLGSILPFGGSIFGRNRQEQRTRVDRYGRVIPVGNVGG